MNIADRDCGLDWCSRDLSESIVAHFLDSLFFGAEVEDAPYLYVHIVVMGGSKRLQSAPPVLHHMRVVIPLYDDEGLDEVGSERGREQSRVGTIRLPRHRSAMIFPFVKVGKGKLEFSRHLQRSVELHLGSLRIERGVRLIGWFFWFNLWLV
ncbi:MAG: hypothetical protein DI637_01670 [Citromicrobium sp.]|nr:MAG: hypothetical protein DI637_01670 [Citromicrobium sp.]